MKRTLQRVLALLLLPLWLVVGCSEQPPDDGRPLIYASFYPVQSMVEDIAGDTAHVESFMPSDKDPHLWEPTPKDMAKLADADLLVVNGANFESWLPQVQDALPDLTILRLSDYIDLISYQGEASIGEFKYLVNLGFQGGNDYSIIFGHTHERFMHVGFFKNDEGLTGQKLIDKAKSVMNEEGPETPQTEKPQVHDGDVFKVKMGYESGQFDFSMAEDGDWVFVSDRISENILPYHLVDSRGNRIEPVELVQGGSAKTDQVTFDPHSWLSPVNARYYANAINDTLTEL